MKQTGQQSTFKKMEDQRSARILTLSIFATIVILLIVIGISMFPMDRKTISACVIGIVLLMVPLWLVKRDRIHAGSVLFVLTALGLTTHVATVGQGIHDIAIIAYPIIFIFAGMNMNRAFFRLIIALAMGAVLWLAVGENMGWYIPQPLLISNWLYLAGVAALLLLAAFTVELLIANIRTNLVLARQEIAKRMQTEEKFRAIFDTTGDGILIADFAGKKFTDGNKAICDMLGYTLEEIKNMGVADIHPEEQLASVIEDFHGLPGQGNFLQLDIPLKRKDGSTLYADINSTVIILAGEKYRLGIFRDATKRIKAEEALQMLNEDLKIAQRLTKIGNWKWVTASGETTWSEQLCHINGWDPNVPVPPFAEMEKFYTPDSWKRLNEMVTKALTKREPYEAELEQIRTDGARIVVFVRGECNLDAEGRVTDLHGTVQDVTETKHLQEQLLNSHTQGSH